MAKAALKTRDAAIATVAVEVQAADGATTEVVTTPADPFANLPTVTVGESTLPDLTVATAVNNPFKYAEVQAKATEAKSSVKPGWKYANAIFAAGRTTRDLKPSTAHGMIHQIAATAGKAGVTAQELVTRHRIGQIGNKRSKYCEALPPVGWSEGWIDTAVTKKIITVIGTTAAPAPAAPAPAASEDEAQPEAQAE